MFLTGHGRAEGGVERGSEGAPTWHWPSIAAAAAEGVTLVIYMGIATAAALQAGLRTALAADTPVAIVQDASLPQQRHATCRLDALAEVVEREGLGSPAIIVVGDVVRGVGLAIQRAPGVVVAA
jgi:uroporphyrin-III C-methyltransferase